MSIESDSDRLDFLSVDEFGVSATITSGSSTRSVVGIFDNAHFEIDNGVSIVSTTEPSLLCRTKDVSTVEEGAVVKVEGQNWTVADIMPDGTGMTMLKLHRA